MSLSGHDSEAGIPSASSVPFRASSSSSTRPPASAGESARLAEGEYKNGIVSVVGLIDAQTAQTETERRLVQSRLDWYTAKARFERAVAPSVRSN